MANAKGALGAHLKKQNVFFYLSAISSVVIIAMLFVPWLVDPVNASPLELLIKCFKNTDLMIFMIPVTLGIVIVHGMYLFSLFRPGQDPMYMGTVSVLLAGILMFLFIFATDIGYANISVETGNYTDSFMVFIGADRWLNTPLDTALMKFLPESWALLIDRLISVPVLWFFLTILQKVWFTPIAHKKEVISYV